MAAQQVRHYNQRNIKLRRVVQFNPSSIGCVIPKTFADKLKLKAGDYVSCELSEEGNSFTVRRV